MNPEQQQRVFEPFVQAEHSLTSRSGGTGLGLAICARLAERMQAQLSMHSEVGLGTRMTLELELAEASAEQLAQASDRAMAEATAPTRLRAARLRTPPSMQEAEACGQLVLVVDDHPINRMVLEGQLNRLGYATDMAEDGAIALAKLQRRRYGLVITDCNMPEMNGYQLAAAMRDWESRLRRPRTPLIACTANALRGEIERCLEAGMDDYLAKPTGLAHLAEKLDRWLPLAERDVSAPNDRTGAEPAPLNGAALNDLARSTGRDPKKLLATFRRTNEADAAKLLTAACQLDLDTVVHAAHRMKGAVRMLGAGDLGAICSDIESAARAGDAQGVQQLIPEFEQALERLDDLLVKI